MHYSLLWLRRILILFGCCSYNVVHQRGVDFHPSSMRRYTCSWIDWPSGGPFQYNTLISTRRITQSGTDCYLINAYARVANALNIIIIITLCINVSVIYTTHHRQRMIHYQSRADTIHSAAAGLIGVAIDTASSNSTWNVSHHFSRWNITNFRDFRSASFLLLLACPLELIRFEVHQKDIYW